FQVLSQASAYVLSSNASVDLKDPDKLEKIEDLMEQDIKARLEKVLAKTRKARSDAFLMSQYLDWRYPKVWRKIEPEWREYYAAELPIEVKIKIKLDRTGGITRSVTQNNYKKRGADQMLWIGISFGVIMGYQWNQQRKNGGDRAHRRIVLAVSFLL
ncbi:hypothetical protein GNF78_16125, partial [Clostridium perfringens]